MSSGRKFFLPGSPSRTIMNLVFYCGCLPYRCLSLFKDNANTFRRSALELVNNGYLEEVRYKGDTRVGIRTLIPTKMAISMGNYSKEFFQGQEFFVAHGINRMRTDSGERQTQSEIKREQLIQRNLTTSEAAAFFVSTAGYADDCILSDKNIQILPGFKAGYEILSDSATISVNKAEYFRPNGLNIEPNTCAFYTSWELKMGLPDAQARACNGRIQGMIFNGGHVYSVLNMPGKFPVLIRGSAELDTRLTLTNAMQKFCTEEVRLENQSTVILAARQDLIWNLLKGSDGGRDKVKTYYSIDEGSIFPRESLYFPLSREGAMAFSMILTSGGRQRLITLYAHAPKKTSGNITCDYEEDNLHVLCFLIPDLYRLRMFTQSAAYYKDQGFVIYCYSFMEQLVLRYIKAYSNIKVIGIPVEQVFADFKTSKRGFSAIYSREGDKSIVGEHV